MLEPQSIASRDSNYRETVLSAAYLSMARYFQSANTLLGMPLEPVGEDWPADFTKGRIVELLDMLPTDEVWLHKSGFRAFRLPKDVLLDSHWRDLTGLTLTDETWDKFDGPPNQTGIATFIPRSEAAMKYVKFSGFSISVEVFAYKAAMIEAFGEPSDLPEMPKEKPITKKQCTEVVESFVSWHVARKRIPKTKVCEKWVRTALDVNRDTARLYLKNAKPAEWSKSGVRP